MYCVYKLTNKITNLIYVGATNNIKRRMKEHRKDVKRCKHRRFYADIETYGFESLELEILCYCETKEEALQKALELIHSRYAEPITVEQAADITGYGKSNFCKIF